MGIGPVSIASSMPQQKAFALKASALAFGGAVTQAPVQKHPKTVSQDFSQVLGDSGLRALMRLSYDRTGMEWLAFLAKATGSQKTVSYETLDCRKATLGADELGPFMAEDWKHLYTSLAQASLVRLGEDGLALTPFGQSVCRRLESYQPQTGRIAFGLRALGYDTARVLSASRPQRDDIEARLSQLEAWQREVEAKQNDAGAASFAVDGVFTETETPQGRQASSGQEELAYQRAMLTNQRAQLHFHLDLLNNERARLIQTLQDPRRTQPALDQLKKIMRNPPTLFQRAVSWIYCTLKRLLGLG